MHFEIPQDKKFSRRLLASCVRLTLGLLIVGGIFASKGWFPSTDGLTGKRTGWFGARLARNAGSSWNPLAAPVPTPSPQLAKEYIYAGSRLLAVEDANANAAPPADLAIWRPSTGGWWVLGGQGSQPVNYNWGTTGDDPVEGDYDADGKTDFAVFRSETNNWYIVNSATNTTDQFAFGTVDDVPAQADFDGDGKTDPAVFRPGTGTWYIRQSSSGQAVSNVFGNSTDKPYPADHDGDGKADIALWRESNQTFYSIKSSNAAPQTVPHGYSGTPVSADYDGDGKADYAVYNSSDAKWYIRHSSTNQIQLPAVQWGIAGDKPVQNDYDGDNKVDIAAWRPTNSPGQTDVGNWYINQSASGTPRQVQFGIAGDIPVPALYRR